MEYKLKIALCSDLHLEFQDISLENNQDADVLILSGDIFTAYELKDQFVGRGKRFYDFIIDCLYRFPKVVMVMGNHEHYHGYFFESAETIKETFKHHPNFFLLDKESILIDDVVFFGGTLWTDLNNMNPFTVFDVRKGMSDYNVIKHSVDSDNKFMPEDSVHDHKMFLTNLQDTFNKYPTNDFVVIGHHAPSRQSIRPEYATHALNDAYASNLDLFIEDNPRIKLWTHGHTHYPFDYQIGSTRVVCNPRGYAGHEELADHFQLKYIQL